jgi:hypothetical protein
MTLSSSNTGNQYEMSRYGPVSRKQLKGGRLPDRFTVYQHTQPRMRRPVPTLRGGNFRDNLKKVGTVVKGQITRQRVKKICDILDAGLKGTSMDKPKPRATKPKAKPKKKGKKKM